MSVDDLPLQSMMFKFKEGATDNDKNQFKSQIESTVSNSVERINAYDYSVQIWDYR